MHLIERIHFVNVKNKAKSIELNYVHILGFVNCALMTYSD